MSRTKGPLAISKIGNNYDQYTIYDQQSGETVANTVEGIGNARLVAAAPELLEALEMATRHIAHLAMEYSEGDHGDRVYPLDVARAAIAKATGGQS